MANQYDLYSYKGEEPKFLPDEIILSDGSSRTDVSSFTDYELLDAGYTGPYSIPTVDPSHQYYEWNTELSAYEVKEVGYQALLIQFTETANNKISEFQHFLDSRPFITEEKYQEFLSYSNNLKNIKENPPLTKESILSFEWPVRPIYDSLPQEKIDAVIAGFSTCTTVQDLSTVLILNNVDLQYVNDEDYKTITTAGEKALGLGANQ